MDKPAPIVYFADIASEALDGNLTLPAKFKRMLKKFSLPERVKGKSVAIKMHLGGGIGYTTVHPFFVRILVDELREAGARHVKIMDGDPAAGVARGYVPQVVNCPIVSCFGETGKYLYKEKIGYKGLDEALFGGEAVDCDFFLDLAHAKGHGDCGYGGAVKNISMGVVPGETRGKLHGLEGGISYDQGKCKFCLKCREYCRTGAIMPDKEKKIITFFWHHCTYCKHCETICPEKAIKVTGSKFADFSKGMALVAAAFLKKFKPENLLFVNFLTNITVFCDCWGFSTASLVPDIGILASDDIAAVDTASLDLINKEEMLPKGLPEYRKQSLAKGNHIFERIHGKDPYLIINDLADIYPCSAKYVMEEIK